MKMARVIGSAVSTLKHDAYHGKKLMIVQPLSLEAEPEGEAYLAVDYVGAGEGDVVLIGSAPGVAQKVFNVKIAPMRELIMGIIDEAEVEGRYIYRVRDESHPQTK